MLSSQEKIKMMKVGGLKLVKILENLEEIAKPAVNLLTLERKAWELIEKSGGYPSFAKVPGYHHATCLNVNDGLVHGIPHDYFLKEGDLLNIDIGFFYKGYHTDCAKSFIVGQKNQTKKWLTLEHFLKKGKEALEKTINLALAGNYVGQLSATIQKIVEGAGYWCSRKYSGHGIGKNLHEPPTIPCFLNFEIEKTPILNYNTTIAIEVIYMMEKDESLVSEDGWSVKTAKGSLAACFEKTIAVGKKNPLVLTPW